MGFGEGGAHLLQEVDDPGLGLRAVALDHLVEG